MSSRMSNDPPGTFDSPLVAAELPRARAQRRLTDIEFSLFAAIGRPRTVPPGETIFRKGERGHTMFVVESGEIHLEFGDGLPRKLIGAREFFGELALFIGDHTRVASASAVAPTRVCVVDNALFDSILEREPRLLARFMRRSFAYLVASEQQLIEHLKRRNEDLIATLHSLRQTQTLLSAANTLVRTDELTGLINRRGLYQFLETLDRGSASERQLALLLIDLDRFKEVNDELGHLAGDQALRIVAGLLAEHAGEGDLCCRLGGDEFALLMQLDHRDELETRSARIVASVRGLRLPPPHQMLFLSVSVGASFCDADADWSTWYSHADRALYEAKAEGGDGWRLRSIPNL
ncbi:MAG: GGDEF domain-containing protein [Proteobacteria bacterium]|uniref:GGDEF domain-containing protein n=1 Tax=Rudaea sp. TaxID=2136325 RepID=UPI0032205713|nr:GGDEF domain-containing protein [Pseudomonadota bacterium]